MDRKEKVKILEKHLGIKSKYLATPSFAYEVGNFIVDRDGKIISGEGSEVELDDVLNPEETSSEKIIAEIVIPLEGHSVKTLKNLINMIYSKQLLIKKAFKIDKNLMEEEIIEKLNGAQTIEEFKNILLSENIKIEDENITFTINTDLVRTATLFFGLLNEKSKELKYALSKPIKTDNEKYTFRTWLNSLGMIGDEYKETRKELLENLSGNSSFRKPGENDEA